MKTNVAGTLDPSQYTVGEPTAAVDTFRMTNDEGDFVTDITEAFIDRLCANMNRREYETGDLCPMVIGHTPPVGTFVPEEEFGAIVGYARNWRKGTLGNTGRICALFDPWVMNDQVEKVKKFPRRSCEIWVSRCEVDPISLLGASTPARDLGLMKLNRNGSYTFESPGEIKMPDDKKAGNPATADSTATSTNVNKAGAEAPPADPKLTGAAVHDTGLLQQILATLGQLVQAQTGGTGVPNPDPTGALAGNAGADQGQGQGEMSDEEFEQLLNEGEQNGDGEEHEEPDGDEDEEGKEPEGEGKEDEELETSRKGETPVQNSASAGGDNTYIPALVRERDEYKAKLSRVEAECDALRVQLARKEISDRLGQIADVDAKDEALIADLVAMEPDMRSRQIERIEKLSGRRPSAKGNASFMVNTALANSVSAQQTGKRVRTVEERNEIIKLARDKKTSYESAARDLGYEL